MVIAPERKALLNSRLMLFFTGFARFSADIQKDTKATLKDKTAQLKEMLQLVDAAEQNLVDKYADLDEFGRMLDCTWRLKRQTGSKISTTGIDALYERALKAGALGGKLLGAGGGGFLVFYVPDDYQENVMKEMKELLFVPFTFENHGTQIIHYSPENYTNA